jgi:PadR family transcriptional regulator PadR
MESPVTTRMAILAVLISGKSYGLEVIDRVRDQTKGALVLDVGNVYPVLRAMEREGLLRSVDGEKMLDRGGRPRRYYELTAEGRRVATAQPTALIGLLLPAGVFG